VAGFRSRGSTDSGAGTSRPEVRRVLFLVTRSILGGAQSHVLELVKAFTGRTYEVALGTGCEGPLTEAARDEGVAVHILPHLVSRWWSWNVRGAVAEVERLVGQVQPDLVSTHSFKAGFAGRLAARRCGVPSIYTAHGWPFSPGIPWVRRRIALPLERLAASWCRMIITVSAADRELALRSRLATAAKLVTVRNGVPDTDLRAVPGGPGLPRVVMIARFEPQKDYALVLRALQGLNTDFRADLVGDGPTRGSAEGLVRRLQIEEKVQFLGFRRDAARILSEAHVFALASRWEGLPLTILEAMRAGLPVVASDVGGVREAVVEGETGFLVPRGDVGAFRARLEKLLTSSELRGRMGAAGRKRYEAHFRVERMLAETAEVYRGVLSPALKG
jgi:glycosyltransferase involved in cell wall biosynthesis